MKNSLKQLKIKMQQKNLVVVGGNVYDSFLNNDQKSAHKFCSLNDKIVEIAEEIGYKTVCAFSPSKGKQILLGASTSILDEQSDDEFQTVPTIKEQLNDFIINMKNDIEDSELSNKVYIIDFADTLMNQESIKDMVEEAAMILGAILTDNPKIQYDITNLQKNNKIIFVCRDSGNVANDFSSKNIEFASVNINKPNKFERDEIFDKFYALFGVSDANKLNGDTKEHTEAVSLTENFSIKEILQLCRIKTEDENLTFKELFSLAQFNKKDSEWEKMNFEQLNNAETILGEVVKGQDYAIQMVKQNLINASLGLNGIMHSDKLVKPKGILFFSGPTGVGKTELAKQIAKLVFGDENRLIRFDMSEYNHEHSDQRLIGSPPGYVGYDAGGELTNAVKEKPFSVLLFDEVEKAHGKILDKFLQILEDGRLTSSRNELIDFSETFIIFTSNIGVLKQNPSASQEDIRQGFIKAVEAHFIDELKRPELLNRIGRKNIIPFNYITDPKIFKQIIEAKMRKTIVALRKKHNLKLKITPAMLDELVALIQTDKSVALMGGRGIINALSDVVINNLARFIMNLKINGDLKDDEITNINLIINANRQVEFKKNWEI